MNETIWRKNLRNLTRNSWNCGFRRVTLFFWYYWLCCCSKGKLPYAGQLNSKSKNKTLTKIPRKTCLKSLQFALSFCKLCLIFGLWLWHLPLAYQLEEILGQFSRNLTLFSGDYICYISEFATILEFAVQTLEMTITYLKWVQWIYWNYENVNEISILMSNSISTLYRKVKGNLSMIIVIDITCMNISTYVVQCGPSMMLFLLYDADATSSYYILINGLATVK